MRRFLLIAFTALSVHIIAQTNTFPASGNVGIGTITPQQTLTIDTRQSSSNAGVPGVNGETQNGILRLQVNGNSWGEVLDFGMNVLPSYAWIQATNRCNLGLNYNLVLNPNGGNIGIGTTNPQAKLDVNNSIRISPYAVGVVGIGYLNTGTELKLMNGDIYNSGGNSITKISFGGMYNPSGSSPIDCVYNSIVWESGQLKIQNKQQDKLIIGGGDEWGQQNVLINPQGGNIGIGTTNPDQKLTVKGKIHAEEVIVDLNVPVADYVFHPTYKLMPLNQVEQYVKTNNHLPEIPSASEVAKNGMNMGEMQNKLLQKVEELTLYAIEQDKSKKELEKKYNALLEKVKLINKQIKSK